jgi:hypothetical protein
MATGKPRAWIVEDFGDSDVIVREFPDGIFAVQVNGSREGEVLLRPEDMQRLVGAFERIGKDKGWT